MQERRRKELSSSAMPIIDEIKVPIEYWEELKTKNVTTLDNRAGAHPDSNKNLLLPFLNKNLKVDMQSKSILEKSSGQWEKSTNSVLELVVLVYLLNATTSTIKGEMVSAKDLKNAHFFQGPHTINTSSLIQRFGTEPEAFLKAGESQGGTNLKMADASFSLLVFPKIPLYYLLWTGDEEFSASLSILFDYSIEDHLQADAIWGLVNFVSNILLSV